LWHGVRMIRAIVDGPCGLWKWFVGVEVDAEF
jgi:hypothetical protein